MGMTGGDQVLHRAMNIGAVCVCVYVCEKERERREMEWQTNKVKERLSNKADRRRDRKLQSLGLGRGESDL